MEKNAEESGNIGPQLFWISFKWLSLSRKYILHAYIDLGMSRLFQGAVRLLEVSIKLQFRLKAHKSPWYIIYTLSSEQPIRYLAFTLVSLEPIKIFPSQKQYIGRQYLKQITLYMIFLREKKLASYSKVHESTKVIANTHLSRLCVMHAVGVYNLGL